MKLLVVMTLALAALKPSASLADCHPATPDAVSAGFDVQKIADGVFAAIRKEPPGIFVDANSVFIINSAGYIEEKAVAMRNFCMVYYNCIVF